MSSADDTGPQDTRDMLTRIREDLTNLARTAVVSEAMVAQGRYGDFASMHEAYGVLAEEVAELFEGVRLPQGWGDARPPSRSDRIRFEAIQVAAVALRIAEQAGRVVR
jgi:hypothetical protein